MENRLCLLLTNTLFIFHLLPFVHYRIAYLLLILWISCYSSLPCDRVKLVLFVGKPFILPPPGPEIYNQAVY